MLSQVSRFPYLGINRHREKRGYKRMERGFEGICKQVRKNNLKKGYDISF